MSNGQLRLERLYLKDASFESPGSPGIFGAGYKPEFQLDINSRSSELGDDRFEMVLTVTVRAKLDGDRTAFIAEVQQAGVFVLDGVGAELRHRVLGTVCPNMLFPYVRETIDSLVVKGGFPALQLAPVNFDALYADALRRQQEQAEAGPQDTH